MTSGRDNERSSGIWVGALTIWVTAAAVIVTALALSVPKLRLAAVVIGVLAAVIFVFTLTIVAVQKSINNRRTRRKLNEERALIVEMDHALEKVKRDLEASSDRSGSLDTDMQAMNDLIARAKARYSRDSPAGSVAYYVDKATLRPQDPEASLRSVMDAKERCARALAVHAHIEQERGTTGRGLKLMVRHSKPGPRKIPVSRRKFRALAASGFRIPRRRHKAIADAPSADTSMLGTVISPRAEGGSEMSGVSTLPVAVEYQEKLALLKSRLSNLDHIPMLPHYITDDAKYKWRDYALNWTVEARSTFTNAVDLASIHERCTRRSGRLAQASEDAEFGLRSIRGLIDQLGESADISEFRRQCEVVIAAIADIVAYAAGM